MRRIAKNLTWLMDKFQIDTLSLSHATQLGSATVNSLRRGVGNPTLATMVALSQYFKISLTELTETDLFMNQATLRTVKTIPLIKLSQVNQFVSSELTHYTTYSLELDDEQSCFAVSINNDALAPYFTTGAIFVVSPRSELYDGDIVLLKIQNHAPCFRKVFIDGDQLLFSSIMLENEVSPSIYRNYTIIGVVLKAIKTFTDR